MPPAYDIAHPGAARRGHGATIGIVPKKPTVKFRHPAALAVAGVVVLISGIPLAATAPWLSPILLVPLVVTVWAWRAGTDADADGLRVRALVGSRQLPWDRVAQLVPTDRRVLAELTDGGQLVLSAVTPADLPRLVTASGRTLTGTPDAQR